MENDWGTNVGVFVIALTASFLLITVVRSIGGSAGFGGFVTEFVAFLFGITAFFGVMYVYYRLLRGRVESDEGG